MGYYQGDHYRSRRFAGDYYRGDPGFFSDLGRALKRVVRSAISLTPFGAAGSAIGTALEVRDRLRGAGVNLPVAGPGLPPGVSGLIASGERALTSSDIGIMAPGGGGLITTTSPYGTPVHPAAIAMQLARMRHTHPNKSTYITRGGGTSRWPQQILIHPKHTEAVTNRRMNVGNARALRRALRRARGFAKLAHRVLAATHRFKGKGFGRARKRR